MINFGMGVYLGPLDSQFKETIRHWRNDYNIYKWCRQSDVITDLDQDKWFDAQSKDKSIKMYLIYREPSPQNINSDFHRLQEMPIGVCGFTSIDTLNRRAEFSLYIQSQFQKCRFGKKALYTLFSHGFKNLGLNCIWGETFVGNYAAQIFESIGMIKEGTRRDFYFKEGRFIDCHLYSILEKEWDKSVKQIS